MPRRSWLGTLPLALVTMLALGLLCYLGYGEARRTYTSLVLERLAAQDDTVRQSMTTFLLQDLPLAQFPGFASLSTPLLHSDATITAIYVTDAAGRLIFANTPAGANLPPADLRGFQPAQIPVASHDAQVTETPSAYRVGLPLQSNAETVGTLFISINKVVIQDQILLAYRFVLLAAAAIILLSCTLYVLLLGLPAHRVERWSTITYVSGFVVMVGVIVAALTSLYVTGIENKSQALATSLAGRLDVPLRYGLDLSAFTGLDQLLSNYQSNSGDISYVALTRGNTILVQSGLVHATGTWHTPAGVIESISRLGSSPSRPSQALSVHMGTSQLAVLQKLYQSIKNFSALFIASILISTVLHRFRLSALSRASRTQEDQSEHLLSLIIPLYFVAVFADSLNNSFLPQHFQRAVDTAHGPSDLVSFMFTGWYLAYALALFPSGLLAEKYGYRPLFICGALLTTCNLAMLAATDQYTVFYLTQFIDGLGQGMIFIGVQSYVLRLTSAGKRTQGVGIVVFGFNGGLIAGNAVGSLLAVDPAFGERGVFLIGSVLSLLLVLYTALVIPRHISVPEPRPARTSDRAATRSVKAPRSIGTLLRDRTFSGTALLVGVPTKIVMAGVMAATLPMVLERARYQTQDIGQLLMLYSCGVLISSRFVSRLADRRGNTRGILMAGLLGTAVGLVLTGTLGWPQFSPGALFPSLAVIAGLAILGLAHGCIQAPSLTHAASSAAASQYGAAAALSFYRLLERIGNISGPIVVGSLLMIFNQSASAISVLGFAFVALLALFAAIVRSPAHAPAVPALQPAG